MFEVDVIVDFSPNAGSRMKAVLLQNTRGVAVCKTAAHKVSALSFPIHTSS
jgi:hypothetical protein